MIEAQGRSSHIRAMPRCTYPARQFRVPLVRCVDGDGVVTVVNLVSHKVSDDAGAVVAGRATRLHRGNNRG